jgi:hypothetical protein
METGSLLAVVLDVSSAWKSLEKVNNSLMYLFASLATL